MYYPYLMTFKRKSIMKELDKTDLKILKFLQQNARIPMTELAEKVGLSTTPVTERVKRLERDNFITGYHARLNPNLLGKGLLIFVELKLRSKSGNILLHLPAAAESRSYVVMEEVKEETVLDLD